MAESIQPFQTAMSEHQNWALKLENQMRAMSCSWVMPEYPTLSFEGFAVFSRLNDIVRYAPPFSEPTREILDEDLGNPIEVDDAAGPDERDAAHLKAGMNPRVFAISPSGMGEVLIQTGFVLKAEYTSIPTTTDGSDPELISHSEFNKLITIVEQNLRHLINTKMTEEYGENWSLVRVHSSVLAGWKSRHDDAVERGEAPLDLINYSDFMDLKDIIIRREHWNRVFKVIFKKREHFITSMERLHPIRVPLAHSRPLGHGQLIQLISESGLILHALGINIFRN